MNEKAAKLFRKFAKAMKLSAAGHNTLRAKFAIATEKERVTILEALRDGVRRAALHDSPLMRPAPSDKKLIA